MIVKICIGSACHLKGSYHLIHSFKSLIDQHALTETVTLKSAFCLGHCAKGISIQIDDQPVDSVLPENADAYFHNNILAGLED